MIDDEVTRTERSLDQMEGRRSGNIVATERVYHSTSALLNHSSWTSTHMESGL